ncbi:MAG TPA: hypothetical protein PKY77_09230 [Phycisphaerae bacterium]|nr:hypothetical protein [Phycisphaerae bacterium]HRY68357.1 hypothetical protein [Phycisphaerae bacterium]HSA28310.1 hypothetical protein [Phycisphaerae bacterium]
MRLAWVGLAVLSGSWLLGQDYYESARPFPWLCAVVLGSLFLVGVTDRIPRRGQATLALLMLLVCFGLLLPRLESSPLPLGLAPILLAVGSVFVLLPLPGVVRRGLGGAGLAAGLVVLTQQLVLLVYEVLTSRSHDLPSPLPRVLAAIASLAGADAAATQADVALGTMRRTHMLGATWELLIDPATLCLLAGGFALLAVRSGRLEAGTRGKALALAMLRLAVCLAVWLPVRAGLLITIFLHRALRTDYDADLGLTKQFWSPWVHMLLLIPPVVLFWCFVDVRPESARKDRPGIAPAKGPGAGWPRGLGAVLFGIVSVILLTAATVWSPVGERKAGRVLVDEYHSQWERTDRPYDTEWYGHESGYNYACVYDYLSRFYDMGRLESPISDEALRNCDVLVLKTPTKSYTDKGNPGEVEAIGRFVQGGGGVLLIGEHTNVFGTGTYLNQVAERFGFRYRYDCLFRISASPFEQGYVPSVFPHPVVQHLREMDFAVSCSIAPSGSGGRAVIRSTGLKSLPADYHASNFYPQIEDRAEGRYGAFIQLWSTRSGAGRVLAFTDSTIFSNFAAFERGKPELMLGMIEWLNHRETQPDPRWPLTLGGAVSAVICVLLVRGRSGTWLPLAAAGMLSWAATGTAVGFVQRGQMPLPKPAGPMVRVAIDRTYCRGPLSKGGFISAADDGFGIFERWILRLGYFTQRTTRDDVFDGDLVVLFYPHVQVSRRVQDQFSSYVRSGGKLLIIDSPKNTNSTANRLLGPYKMEVVHADVGRGTLVTPKGWPTEVAVQSAAAVAGGDPFVTLHGRPVAARVSYGRGTVTVVGFGSRFSDAQMGVTGDVVPSAELRRVFDLEFVLLRSIIEADLATRPAVGG